MLNLRSLRHFVVLAERLNYSRAADELGITQPTLTRSIQALELRLGLKLFDRSRSGVQLTPMGARTATRARYLLIDAEDLEKQSATLGAGLSGRVRFGMTPMPAHALLHTILSARLAQYPEASYEVVIRSPETLWGMLISGDIEFFVSADPPQSDRDQAIEERLGSSPLSLLVRAEHPLLSEPSSGLRFPLVRASWAGLAIPTDVQPWVLGEATIIEDFGILERIALSTDCMWLSSAHAVPEKVRSGKLAELYKSEGAVELLLYSLRRRNGTPLALRLIEDIRQQVAIMTVGSNGT